MVAIQDGDLPDMLVVLKVTPKGRVKTVYYGPAARAWELAGPVEKNGQRRLALSKLADL